MRDHLDALARDGFTVLPGLFDAADCAVISRAAGLLERLAPGKTVEQRFGNVRFFSGSEGQGESLRSTIWCALLDPELEALRRDPRLLAVLEPLIGDTILQVTNQIHTKIAGSRTSFPPHTDRSSRERAQGTAIRNLERSFFQTAIVAEDTPAERGALFFLPGSHRWSPGSSYAAPVDEYRHPGADFQPTVPEGFVVVEARAGDLVVWHGDTVHGSALNLATEGRRPLYINGYVSGEDALRGYWAWIQGQAVRMPGIEVPVVVYGAAAFDAFDLPAGVRLRAAYQALLATSTPLLKAATAPSPTAPARAGT